MDGKLEQFNFFMNFGMPILILVIAYFIGSWIERKHFKNIRDREAKAHGFPVVSFDTMPDDWKVDSSHMVTGSIVISLD